MRVRRIRDDSGRVSYEFLDDDDRAVPLVTSFLRHLDARGCSPNTLSAYAHDLLHFSRFLQKRELGYGDFTPAESLAFLEYLREIPSRRRAQRFTPVLVGAEGDRSALRLAPATVNRILAAVSSFYEYLIISGHFEGVENPIRKVEDPAASRVSERHKPFMGRASRQKPIRRVVRVRMVWRVPRPLSEDQVGELLGSLKRWRDRAMLLLMLQGGLRPGEVLNLHLQPLAG